MGNVEGKVWGLARDQSRSDAFMKRVDAIRNPVLRHVLAGAPRLVCDACGEMFLYGSIFVRLKLGQHHTECPKCKAIDTLRYATREEMAEIMPTPNTWSRALTAILWATAGIGAAFVIYMLVMIERQS